ncbi:MAG: chromosome segregation protein SMC [Mariprofundaceae bacterium]
MRLKALELSGFKSFVDPTRIEFGEGVTAIVGPNGCGKSNIVDAVRWVLGEHSARHLRGGVMDDLIFQGSDTRPPVAVCDVELTFAVEPGQLPPPWHELDEIRIRRRLTREGGSDAFINGKAVRLKDVVDLFLDTGVSTRAYAIVEQGAIARMVTAKPDERRAIFEEAAGVMKYRTRRREAERKMQSTRQNLERVADLLEEVRTQCRSLKQQASRAERFRAMQQEHEHLQSLAMAMRLRDLRDGLNALESRLREAAAQEGQAAAALASAEKRLAAARDAWVGHETEAQQAQDRLREAEARRAELQRLAERAAGEARLMQERKESLAARLAESERALEGRRAQLDARRSELEAQDDGPLLERKARAEAEVQKAQAALREQSARREALLAEFERLRHARDTAEQQRARAEAHLQRLTERDERLRAQQVDIKAELAQQRTALQEAERQLARLSRQKEAAGQALEAAQARLDAAREARDARAQSLRQAEGAQRRLAGEVEELRARTRDGDVPESLREQVRAAGGVWVDESLETPEGLEAAVAAALRGRAADARLPASLDADAWGALLDTARDAPVAFHAGGADAGAVTGSLADALGLGRDHPLFPVFAGVRLVEGIGQVRDADAAVVSRDGWRREPQGWIAPPAGSRTADRLAMRRRLREAESGLREASKALEAGRAALTEAEGELTAAQQAWQSAHVAVTETENAARDAGALCERLRKALEAGTARLAALAQDARETGEERAHWQAQLEAVGRVDEAAIHAAQSELAVQRERTRQGEEALGAARADLAQADQALALFRQAQDNLRREIGRLEGEIARIEAQRSQDAARLAATERALAEARRQQSLDRDLAAAAEVVEAAHRALNELRRQGHALQQSMHEAEKAEREARRAAQEAAQARQAIEVQQAQEQARLQDLHEEILRRCRVEPDALLDRLREHQQQEDSLPEAQIAARARELEERLARFGPVNLMAIEEYDQAAERERFLSEQAADLEASLGTLEDTIARIDRTMRRRFHEVFEQTDAIFRQTFPQLFGGGRAELRLDSDDILTAGVEVIAQPPGKRLQDIGLLSGGEKALTAVALVFSIFRIKPAPFCVLDEVDAPLDDANVGRFNAMIRELADRVQFLAITHNKITMQAADKLIGVSMPEPGVSRIVAVDLEAMPD